MSRERTPGDGPKCWCGEAATFGGYCNSHHPRMDHNGDPRPGPLAPGPEARSPIAHATPQQALEALRILADYATSFDDAVKGEPMPVGAQAAHDTIKAVLEAVAKEQADWETLARWREAGHTATGFIAMWRNGEGPSTGPSVAFEGEDRRAEILTELEELNSKERAEFAKHDLLAVLLKKPNKGFEATTWIRNARGAR